MGDRSPWSRLDAAIAGALALVTLLTRAAVRAREPTTWDAGLFALGVRDYDVLAGQPHAPGYPLTIALAKLLALATRDPAEAMVWLSVLASAAMAVLAYGVGRALVGRAAGAFAGVLLLLSPVALYNGAVGLSYAAEGAASAGVAWLAWRAAAVPTRWRLVGLGLGLAAAAGIRPSSLLFLAPLAAWPLVAAAGPLAARAKRAAVLGGAALAGGLAWLLPMLAFGGGQRVLEANRFQSATVVFPDPVWVSGWQVVPRNLERVAEYAHRDLPGLWWLVPSLVLLVVLAFPARLAWRKVGATAGFLALWVLPAFLFYALVYVGWPIFPDGYLLVLAPGVAVALGALVAGLSRVAWGKGVVRQMGVGAAAALLLVPTVVLASAWPDAARPIQAADDWAASWDGFDEAFPANSTAVLTLTSWLYLKLREPEHLQWVTVPYNDETGLLQIQVIESRHGHDAPRYYLGAFDGLDDPVHPIPDWVERIVLHEGQPNSGTHHILRDDVPLHETVLPTGRVVRWFEPNGDWQVLESYLPWSDPTRTEEQPRHPPAAP